MARRLVLAVATMATMSVTVLLDRDGYDDRDGVVSVLDAVYYAGVSLSTTGYGDVVPVTDAARLGNVAVVMPLQPFFLALLVGTTFEVLTQRPRRPRTTVTRRSSGTPPAPWFCGGQVSAELPGSSSPLTAAGDVIGDLLVQGHGLHLIDRPVRPDESAPHRQSARIWCWPWYAAASGCACDGPAAGVPGR